MNKAYTRQLIEINIAMILISTSGALGRYITLSPMTSIWSRSSLAAMIMLLFCLISRYSLRIHGAKDITKLISAGIFLGTNWVLYFYSLQLTNAAVGMLVLFTYPLFTSILEPIFLGSKWSINHLISSLAVFLGLYILLPSFDIESDFVVGILLGLVSSLCYTIRNLILKTQVNRYNGSVMMAYQLVIVSICLLPFLHSFSFQEVKPFVWQLITLALVTTSLGHTLFLKSFKHFSISVASILGSLQPVYGIIIALVFLGEVPDINSIIGGALILGTVIYTGWSAGKGAEG